MPALRWPLVVKQRGKLLFVLNYSDQAMDFCVPAAGIELLADRAVRAGESLRLDAWGASVIARGMRSDPQAKPWRFT